MTELTPITLEDAETSVAVANTPIFLARRLRDNPAVRRALILHGAQNIFLALQSVSTRKPANLSEATEAYFYLVALSLDGDLSWLQRAEALAAPHLRWFTEVAAYLTLVSKATVSLSFDVPSKPAVVANPTRNNAATTTRLIRL